MTDTNRNANSPTMSIVKLSIAKISILNENVNTLSKTMLIYFAFDVLQIYFNYCGARCAVDRSVHSDGYSSDFLAELCVFCLPENTY